METYKEYLKQVEQPVASFLGSGINGNLEARQVVFVFHGRFLSRKWN